MYLGETNKYNVIEPSGTLYRCVHEDSFQDLRHWSTGGILSNSGILDDSLLDFNLNDIDVIRFYLDTNCPFKITVKLPAQPDEKSIGIESSGTHYIYFEDDDKYDTNIAFELGVNKIKITKSAGYIFEAVPSGDLVPSGIAVSDSFSELYCNLQVSGIVDDLALYRKQYDDYQSGTGDFSDCELLDVERVGHTYYPNISAGYFYSNNEEYYLFGNPGVIRLTRPSGIIDDYDETNTIPYSGVPYFAGSPYFITDRDDIYPSGLIDPSGDIHIDVLQESGTGLCYVKTPDFREYDVDWIEVDPSGNPGYFIPDASGYYDRFLIYDEDEELINYKKVPRYETNLVIDDDVYYGAKSSISTLLFNNDTEDIIPSFLKIEDLYGTPVESGDLKFYSVAPDNTLVTYSLSEGNEDGIFRYDIPVVSDNDSFHIFGSGIDVKSNLKYITKSYIFDREDINIFQLDANLIWDCQEAKTAIGENLTGQLWGSGLTDILLPANFDLNPSGSNPYTIAMWEHSHQYLERPPIDASGTPETDVMSTGVYNGKDYYTDMSTAGIWPEGDNNIRTVFNNFRIAFQGYFGHVLLTGSEIKDIETGIQNATDSFYTIAVDKEDEDSGLETYTGIEGSWNTVHNEASTLYDDDLFVVFIDYIGSSAVPGTDYDVDTLLPIANDNYPFNTNLNFYFRGLAIKNLGNGIDEDRQDYTFEDIVSYAAIQEE